MIRIRALDAGIAAVVLATVGAGVAAHGGGPVPVGTYLYARPEALAEFTGSLTVTFTEPGDRLVVAYGQKNRKDRRTREGTTEQEREQFRPVKARLTDSGRSAHFDHLAPDFYDIIVIEPETMRLYEGLHLAGLSDAAPAGGADFEAAGKSLSRLADRIGGWEAFFDTKDFIRLETADGRGCMLVQQMRLGKALAESGAVLEGCIHSIDVCWLEQAKVEEAGWQVVMRQQLYRDELPARTLFKHAFVPELRRVRVGVRGKTIGPVALPE